MHNILQNFKINPQVCIYSLADLDVGYCVRGQVGKISYVNIIKMEFLNILHIGSERESRFNFS